MRSSSTDDDSPLATNNAQLSNGSELELVPGDLYPPIIITPSNNLESNVIKIEMSILSILHMI